MLQIGFGLHKPQSPCQATLIFEVELLDFVNQEIRRHSAGTLVYSDCHEEDLFSDGGVVKVMVKEGSGWKAGHPCCSAWSWATLAMAADSSDTSASAMY